MTQPAAISTERIDELYTPNASFGDAGVYGISDVNSIIEQLRMAELKTKKLEDRVTTALQVLRHDLAQEDLVAVDPTDHFPTLSTVWASTRSAQTGDEVLALREQLAQIERARKILRQAFFAEHDLPEDNQVLRSAERALVLAGEITPG